MTVTRLQTTFRSIFPSIQEAQAFINDQHSILLLRYSSTEEKENSDHSPSIPSFNGICFVLAELTAQQPQILGYENGSCGVFQLKDGELHFSHQDHLSDSLSINLAHYIISEMEQTASGGRQETHDELLTLLHYLQKKHQEGKALNGSNKLGISSFKLRKINQYIEEHIDAEIGTDQLAKIAGLSLYHFIRMFKRSTGFTPHQYVNHLKMQHAKDLLTQTSLSVIQICFDIGFNNPSHFSRIFKRNFGLSPLKFRQRAAAKGKQACSRTKLTH